MIICPKCQAMCDPDTRACLICGERHHKLSGVPINFKDVWEPAGLVFQLKLKKVQRL